MNELSLLIFSIIFIIVMMILTIIVRMQDKNTVGELHVYLNGDGEPPTWNFTINKDFDLNKVGDIKYATFKVIKEE